MDKRVSYAHRAFTYVHDFKLSFQAVLKFQEGKLDARIHSRFHRMALNDERIRDFDRQCKRYVASPNLFFN